MAAAAASDLIIKTVSNGIGSIVFNNLKTKNSITTPMYVEIRRILQEFAKDDKVVITTLSGNGEYYSSGTDLKNSPTLTSPADVETNAVKLLIDTLIDFPKPLIALVNGPCVGIGVTSLGLCDIVYASDKATFNTPFGVLGFCPEGCSSYLFPKMMGLNKAQEVLIFNRKLTAQEAFDRNLVTRVFPDHTFKTETERLLLEMAKFPPQALAANKQLVARQEQEFLHKVNEKEMLSLFERISSEETSNAIMAFFTRKSSKI